VDQQVAYFSEEAKGMVAERVISLVAKASHVPPANISLDSTFEELGIDSLDAISLVFEIESAFKVDVPDHVMREMHTVRQVVDALEQLLPVRQE
jgi:acyl carrier protein